MIWSSCFETFLILFILAKREKKFLSNSVLKQKRLKIIFIACATRKPFFEYDSEKLIRTFNMGSAKPSTHLHPPSPSSTHLHPAPFTSTQLNLSLSMISKSQSGHLIWVLLNRAPTSPSSIQLDPAPSTPTLLISASTQLSATLSTLLEPKYDT